MSDNDSTQDGAPAQQDHPSSEGADRSAVTIYSDPGRTSMWVSRTLKELEDSASADQEWSSDLDLAHKRALIPLREDATLDLDEVKNWARDDDADFSVVVTEIPRMAGRRPKRSELHFNDSLAIISLPAVGPARIRHCLRRELRTCLDALRSGSLDDVEARRTVIPGGEPEGR